VVSEEVLLETITFVSVGTLFVGVVTLVVAMLTLRSARRVGELAEKRAEDQLEEQERLELIRGLRQGQDWERQERQRLHKELEQERQERLRAQQERLQAQQSAERAEQEALKEATRQLRARIDAYIKEIGEEGTWPGIRRVK
jgi:biopolymer transport protein ExbB/TolQ